MKVDVIIAGASNLRNMDAFHKSDPYCVCEVRPPSVAGPAAARGQGPEKVEFITEVVYNNLSPSWNFAVSFEWDGTCDLVFKVWDKDHLKSDDFLGIAVLEPWQIKEGYDGNLVLLNDYQKGIVKNDGNGGLLEVKVIPEFVVGMQPDQCCLCPIQ